MKPKDLSNTVIDFFFKNGATYALFRWLDFRLYIAQKSILPDSRQSAIQDKSVVEHLSDWQTQATLTTPAIGVIRLLVIISAIMGFMTIAAVLNYSVDGSVNIWIPLAICAFIPFLLTLGSAYFSVFVNSQQAVVRHPFAIWLINKLKLSHFLPYKNVLLPWLFWQLQAIAIVFSLSVLLSFFLLATFQDYHFGWSSTLITNNQTMVQLTSVVSWPWHWFIQSPTLELISQTRLTGQQIFVDKQVAQTWWLTLVMAILVYGLIPRLCLAFYLRKRFIRQLKESILNSSDVEQFIVAKHHQASREPIKSDNESPSHAQVNMGSESRCLVTWQQPSFHQPVKKNLGNEDWLADEQWLKGPDSICQLPVWVVVDPMQTPTGELADCIEFLKQKNDSVTLVLYPNDEQASRYQQQLQSWYFFAKRNHIELKEGYDLS